MARALLLAVLLAVGSAAEAQARLPLSEQVPLLVRITGRPGPPGNDTRGGNDWRIVVERATLRFQVTQLEVMTAQVSSRQILNALDPYTPQLRLYGPKASLATLVTAAPPDVVTVLGYLLGSPGAAQLMVSEVTVGPPAR